MLLASGADPKAADEVRVSLACEPFMQHFR
jgi:hypothetical protein